MQDSGTSHETCPRPHCLACSLSGETVKHIALLSRDVDTELIKNILPGLDKAYLHAQWHERRTMSPQRDIA